MAEEQRRGNGCLNCLVVGAAIMAGATILLGDAYRIRSWAWDQMRGTAGYGSQQYEKEVFSMHDPNQIGELEYSVKGDYKFCNGVREAVLEPARRYIDTGHTLRRSEMTAYLRKIDSNNNFEIEPHEIDERLYYPTKNTESLADCVVDAPRDL